MNDTLIMTPGPTYIHEDVRKAMAERITNPDLDLNFYEYYKDTCDKLKVLLKTESEVLILSGEGILGLEAACASLIEPGDRVLCIDNGIFGNGFGDFAKMYGAEVVYFKGDYEKDIDVDKLEKFLENDNDFKMATVVHCETPSGITNSINKVCPLLHNHGIISVVDSVSAVGGEELKTDDWKIDILLGGSQKCLSAPPGLTFLSISKRAWNKILNRKTSITGYYCNLSNWKSWYEDKWFPYTQPISDIYALRTAVDRLFQDEYILRHKKIAEAVRKSLVKGGLKLYPSDGFSNTVTTMKIPDGVTYKEISDTMLEKHNIMIAGAFGENCYEEKLYVTLKALDKVLRNYGVSIEGELHKLFVSFL